MTSQSDAEAVDGFPLGVYGVGVEDGLVAFSAYAEFRGGGTGRVRGPVGSSSSTQRLHDSEFTFVIDGDQIEVRATAGDCGVETTGTYRWQVEGSALILTPDQRDRCTSRSNVLHGEWHSLGNTPVLEIDPGGEPVTIDSPIGPIEWHIVMGQPFAWVLPDWGFPMLRDFRRPQAVVPIDGGFVGVVDDQATWAPLADQPNLAGRALRFSPDGLDWQPIPSPPAAVGWIAASGETLYVSSATEPEAVYVSADRGDTWTALEVEDPPLSVDGLHAGVAGVVLTGLDTALWLLDDASFERIDTAPARFVQVHVLDTGFFAVSVEESGRKSYWRSDDGRTWTEMTDVPTEIHDSETTSWGDTIYLSRRDAGTGYTSTDGGRTWIAGSRRPGEGLAVTDAGHVTTQPAVFGTGVSGVVWVSSDDTDWQRAVNPWPPLWWTFNPVISGDTILIPSETDPGPGERRAPIDLVGHISAVE